MYQFIREIVRIYLVLIHRLTIIGKENIPKKGKAALLCGNHKSSFDPFIVASCYYPKSHFLAKAELFRWKPFGALLIFFGVIPVNRGKGDVKALRKAIDVLNKGKKLAIFPEGHRYKEFEPKNGKRGAAKLAIKANCPIVPISIRREGKFFIKKVVCIVHEPIYADGRGEREFIDVIMQKIGEGLH